jgi:hypothetical protein
VADYCSVCGGFHDLSVTGGCVAGSRTIIQSVIITPRPVPDEKSERCGCCGRPEEADAHNVDGHNFDPGEATPETRRMLTPGEFEECIDEGAWDEVIAEARRARSGEQTLYRDLMAALAEMDTLKAENAALCRVIDRIPKNQVLWDDAANAKDVETAALKERCEKAEKEQEEWETVAPIGGAFVATLKKKLADAEEKHARGVLARIEETGKLIEERDKAEADAARLRAYVEKATHLGICHMGYCAVHAPTEMHCPTRREARERRCNWDHPCDCGKAAALAKGGT